MSDLIGQELGPYRILEQIGAGGMATIFKAYHPATDRYVAVKILPETMGRDASFRQRFRREAKVVAGLEHAHILPVYDYGEAGDQLYLVMRYVQAGTLKERIIAAPLSLSEISHILSQVGAALAYAHRLGVVHRDVKPANVLLDDQGNCYLSDFGLARMMEASVQITATGVGVGTPAYMSPEQGKGEKVDARTDIYSLGVVLYELVAGQVPFHAETPMAVVIKHISAPLPLPTEVNPDIHPAVERVILKALAKNPDDRFDTVEDLVSAFEAAVRLAEPAAPSHMPGTSPAETAAPLPPPETLLTPVTVATRQRIPPRWRRVALGVTGALILLLALALVLNRLLTQVQTGDDRGDVEQVLQDTKVPPATVTPAPVAALADRPAASPSPRLAAEKARAFAQPILDAIAGRPPNYQEDFDDPASGWPVGSTANGAAWAYQDDAYQLTVTSLYRNPGGDPCLDVGLDAPLGFTDYVLEMDAQFLSGASGNWHTTFRQVIPERAPEEGIAYIVDFVPTAFFDLQRGGEFFAQNQPAPSFRGGRVPNRLTVVAHGPHIAIFVNGEPLWHVQDRMSAGGTVDLGLGACNDDPTPLQVRFDNLRLWDISDLALTATGAAPSPRLVAEKARAFAGPILGATAGRPPDYQEDFDDPASGWPVGSTADGAAWAYQDDAYQLTLTSLYRNPGGDPCLDVGLDAPPAFTDYVLEIDAQFLSGASGNWHTTFRQVIPERAPEEGTAYVVDFVPPASFDLQRGGEPFAQNQPVPSFRGGTAPNRLTVVVHGPHIAIFVNGEPLWHVQDQMSVGGMLALSLGACNDDPSLLQVRFDNLKIWDISDLPPPVP